MKKNKLIYLCVLLPLVFGNVFLTLKAESSSEFEGKETQYTQMCFLDKENKKDDAQCKKFETYLNDKQKKYKAELDSTANEKKDITNNIEEYVGKIKEYEKEIASIDEQIKTIETSNTSNLDNLSTITADIKDKIKEYDEEYTKLKSKLVKLQGYLGTNYPLNFLLTADSLLDISVRAKQLDNLYQNDVKKIKRIERTIGQVDKDKDKYSSDTEKLEKTKQLLSDSKSLSAQLKEQARTIMVIYKQQEAEIMAKQTKKLANLESVKELLGKNKTEIENIQPSEGWTLPVAAGSYSISAGVWHYPESFGGGIHLGNDIAATNGTPIVSPANGVILFSSNSCEAVGGLGNTCGAPGAYGGGNQAYLIMSVDNKLFGVMFAHMEYNSVLPTGSIVKAGEQIGKVGSTGNSSGNHTHMEMSYLGEGSDIQAYVKSWDGDMSFGNEWGEGALQHICDATLDKPHCRVDAKKILKL